MNGLLALLFFGAAILSAVLFFNDRDTDKLIIACLFVACACNAIGDMKRRAVK